MQTFVSISLVILSLIRGMAPGMDLCCELQNLPDLANVCEEHCGSESNLLKDLLVKECADKHKSPKEHHRDPKQENLPLHGNNPCCNSFIFTPVEVPLPEKTPGLITGPEYNPYRFAVSSTYLDTPLQPPRV